MSRVIHFFRNNTFERSERLRAIVVCLIALGLIGIGIGLT